MMDINSTEFWLVVAGFIIAFVLAFGIGANDVANSFGTSVGSKVLTLKQACILATIFEMLGSILIGAQVSGTIRKGILDPKEFEGHEIELMLGYVSALSGCCIWLILATILNLPVSGTHSIVGATIGMAIVSKGIRVIKWLEVLKIVSSWFISPLLSGLVSLLMFVVIRKFILRAPSPLKAGLRYLPAIYTITIFVNIGGVIESSPPLLGIDKIPWWGKLILTFGISVLVYLGIWLILVPFMKRKVEKTLASTIAMQLDQLEEKERLNNMSYENGGTGESTKKAIATQVDYVALLVSRNNEDLKDMAEVPQHVVVDFQPNNKNTKDLQLNTNLSHNELLSHPQASYTIHTASGDIRHLPKHVVKRINNRIRLDSAPTTYKDEFDYGDVNLTLGGYLHTVQSPAYRQQLRNLRTGSFRTHTHQFSLKGAEHEKNVDGMTLSTMFNQNANKGTQKDEIPLLTSPDNLNIPEKKTGRFTSVPAKIEQKTIPQKLDKHNSLNDLDEDYIEDEIKINSKPPKKSAEIDEFAHSDPPEAAKLFSFLQILTAIFGSFAHGGNDVSNAIGPLIGLFLIYQEGIIKTESATPVWILFYGGVGISAGLWILGRRVIKTIGEDLTKITASSGFVIELASAITVLGASLLKIPVSTTHCKVGSVVFTGRVRSKESVDWSLFRNIIIAWIVTVPVTGSIAAGCQLILKVAFGLKL